MEIFFFARNYRYYCYYYYNTREVKKKKKYRIIMKYFREIIKIITMKIFVKISFVPQNEIFIMKI